MISNSSPSQFFVRQSSCRRYGTTTHLLLSLRCSCGPRKPCSFSF